MDQFILGIFAFQARGFFAGRHWLALSIAFGFLAIWYWFDVNGGFMLPTFPSPSPLWIVLGTVEGLVSSLLIAWYDNSFIAGEGRLSRFIALIGAYSYSIYLLHFFLVFRMVEFIDDHVLALTNPYLLLAMAVPCFLAMVPLSILSFRFIEAPFLAFRKPYAAGENRQAVVRGQSAPARDPA